MSMIKKGVIEPGTTIPEDEKEGEKKASLDELTQHPITRLTEKVADLTNKLGELLDKTDSISDSPKK